MAARQSEIGDAEDKVDKKLLRMFQSDVKSEKVVRALEVASQLTALRSLEGALKLANHHRYIIGCSAITTRTSHMHEVRQACTAKVAAGQRCQDHCRKQFVRTLGMLCPARRTLSAACDGAG